MKANHAKGQCAARQNGAQWLEHIRHSWRKAWRILSRKVSPKGWTWYSGSQQPLRWRTMWQCPGPLVLLASKSSRSQPANTHPWPSQLLGESRSQWPLHWWPSPVLCPNPPLKPRCLSQRSRHWQRCPCGRHSRSCLAPADIGPGAESCQIGVPSSYCMIRWHPSVLCRFHLHQWKTLSKPHLSAHSWAQQSHCQSWVRHADPWWRLGWPLPGIPAKAPECSACFPSMGDR